MKNAEIFCLSDEFYKDYPIEKYNQILIPKNARGHYGITILKVFDITFAIPLHSNITHGLKIRQDLMSGKWSGLDFEKAIVIEKISYIGKKYTIQPRNDYNIINRKKKHIEESFKKYLMNYIKAVEKQDRNILNRDYAHTTLIYYHQYLFHSYPKFCSLNPLATQINFG